MYEKAIDVERGPPCDLLERIRSRALRIAFGRSHRNGEERSERIVSRKHDVDKGASPRDLAFGQSHRIE